MGRYSSICYLIISLVISIPLNTSLALAEIVDVQVSGSDAMHGFRRGSDHIEYIVTLDQDASPDNVQTDFPVSMIFESCSGTECTLKFPQNDMTPGMYPYTVREVREGLILDAYSGTLTVDAMAPVIRSFSVSTDRENLSIQYDVDDIACDSCTGCAGLFSINLKEDDLLIWSQELDGCSAIGKASIRLDELSTQEGDTEVCIYVSDAFGQESKSCKDISVDSLAPIIYGDTFRVFDEEGYPLTHILSHEDAVAYINLSDADIESVIGDFSAFDSDNSENLDRLEGSCQTDGDLVSCSFDISVYGVDGAVSAVIYAEDTNGNIAQESVSVDIIYSDSRPTILEAYTVKELRNESLSVHSGMNYITVVIKDNAPFNKADIVLDLHGVEVEAERCIKDQDWYCTFKADLSGIHGSRQSYDIIAKSDAGNLETVRRTLTFDNEKPEIGEVLLSSDCATAAEGLEVTVTFTDPSDVVAHIDASRISNNGELLKADCFDSSCTVFINDLFTAYTKDNLIVNITDAAGNSAVLEKMVEVCEADDSIEPNFVSVTTSDAAPIDKRLVSFLGSSAYVPVSFRKGIAKIISVDVSCRDAGSSRILNKNGATSSLVVDIPKQSLEGSELEVNCSFSFIMRRGNRVYMTPEVEQAEITIPLVNNALGEMGESMQQKIDSVSAEIEDVQDEIEKWEEWNKWLGMLCSIAETLGKINSLLNSIKSVIWGVSCAMTNYPPTKSAGEGLWGTVCRFVGKFSYYVESFFWPTGLVGPNPVGMFVKYGCMIYTCRICDWSQLISVGTSAAAGALLPTSMEYTDSMFSGSGSTITSDYPITGRQDFRDRWLEAAETTKPPLTDDTQWIYDPYKSIHYAKACMCLPAYIYNLKKDRQIKCMYKTCLIEHAEVGLPADSCDVALKERECLYVESAQYKKHGYLQGFFDNLWIAVVQMLPGIIIGVAYSASCPDVKVDASGSTCIPSNTCGNFRPVMCGLAGAAAAITELIDIMDGGLDFSKYDPDLGGTDYCGGTE